ncbi:cysteine-rich repeat secretory 3-like isoform X2, partial [Olea europaea subsp. europaea]
MAWSRKDHHRKIEPSAEKLRETDYNDLVYKGCSNQDFQDFNGIYKQTLKILFDALIYQSSTVKFYKATFGDGQSAINALFQCRGDLSNFDCVNCVKKAVKRSKKLCGHSIAVRVQLNGCYLRYEIAGFRQVSGIEFLYKICGSNRLPRDTILQETETCQMSPEHHYLVYVNLVGSGLVYEQRDSF